MRRINTAMCLAFSTLMIATVARSEEPVTITLKPSVAVEDKIVLIGHIAEVSGGSETVREKIKQLDISAPPTDGPEFVTQQHVQIRLLLADVTKQSYRMAGSEKSSIFTADFTVERGLSEAALLSALQQTYGGELHLDQADVEVRLTQPLPALDEFASNDVYEFRPFLPQFPRLGRARINVGIYAQDRLIKSIAVSVEVRQLQTVAIATTLISREQPFTKDNVRLERRAFSTPQRESIDDSLLGLTSRRAIYVGQSISSRDAEPAAKEASEILIRQRDLVQLVARKGTLRIVVRTGEALQNGSVGQLIRVRNSDSQKIVLGRVVSSTQVEIAL